MTARQAAQCGRCRETIVAYATEGPQATASPDVARILRPIIGHLDQEVFVAVLLDVKTRVLRIVEISRGSLSASLVHPREVFKAAVRDAAHAVILAHNHPSGDPAPSPEDAALTTRLIAAGDVLGIRVLDHVVIGMHDHYSFADSGRLR